MARLRRLENDYEAHGMRRTVEAVLVVHQHNHPHVLMLQIANAFFKLYVGKMSVLHTNESLIVLFDSPGHYLQPGVDEKEGLKQILNERLGPADPNEWPNEPAWEIGDCLSTWWRPNFESYMVTDYGEREAHVQYSEYCTVSIYPCTRYETKRKENAIPRKDASA